MKGQGLSEQELFDYGANLVRTEMSTVPGTAVPWPYGGKQRQVSVNVDIPALQAKGLSPVDVINAISLQNLVLPSGTAKLGPTEYNVEMNGSPHTIDELNDIPVKTRTARPSICATWPPSATASRRRSISCAWTASAACSSPSTRPATPPRWTSSRTSISKLPQIASLLPPQLVMTPLFDQSIFVRAAVQG